jgi:hypothetical protein
MAAGADSTDDMDQPTARRIAGSVRGIPAPSTLGSPALPSFTLRDIRQLEMVGRQLLAELARRAPLLPGKEQLAFIDINAVQKRFYGHQKQGAQSGTPRSGARTCWSTG